MWRSGCGIFEQFAGTAIYELCKVGNSLHFSTSSKELRESKT